MKTIVLVLLSMMSASYCSASEVVFNFHSRWNGAQYLSYFVESIPEAQIEAEADGKVLKVSGPLELNLSRLPEETRASMANVLQQVFDRERQIDGRWIDASQAKITYVYPMTGELSTQQMSAEERSRLQPKVYHEESQFGRGWNCQLRLMGNDP